MKLFISYVTRLDVWNTQWVSNSLDMKVDVLFNKEIITLTSNGLLAKFTNPYTLRCLFDILNVNKENKLCKLQCKYPVFSIHRQLQDKCISANKISNLKWLGMF